MAILSDTNLAVHLTGDWDEAGKLLSASPAKLNAAVRRALRQEAQLLRKMITQGITQQAPGGKKFQKLSPLTIATRRLRVDRKGATRTKALAVRGDLRNSIKILGAGAEVKSGAAVGRGRDKLFVGVPRAARSRDGKKMVQIAAVHEFGSPPIVIPITPAMQRFLGLLFRKAGIKRNRSTPSGSGGVIVVTIPPRPFLRPSFKVFSVGVEKRFQKRVAVLLEGKLGK